MSPATRRSEAIEVKELIARGARSNQIEVEDTALLRLERYVELLARWSAVYNLTSVREPRAIASTHVLDSLSVAPYLRPPDLIDLGTGAGLPGLVLAIARPAHRWVLLDSRSKRTRFCLQVVAELGLDNVQVVCGRAEAYEPVAFFSCLVSRATFDANKLIGLGYQLVRPGGRIIVMQGARPAVDRARLARLGLDARVIPLEVQGLTAKRHLLVVDLPEQADARPTRAVAQ